MSNLTVSSAIDTMMQATTVDGIRSAIGESAVDVASHATGGSGTSGSPWTGWDTAITWTAFTRYNFRSGYFAHSTSPNFALAGIQLIGSAGTIIKHTGTGVGFNMDAGSTPGGTWIQNVLVENIILLGNSNTTNAFFLRGIRNGAFNNLSVRGCNTAGIWTEACVTNILYNFRCTHHEPDQGGTFAVTPKNGIVTTGRGADYSTTWTIINPVVEGVSEEGIWFKSDSYGNTIINGTSEGNTHATKASVRITGRYNVILNLDSEANTSGIDFLVDGNSNQFYGVTCDSSGTFKISSSHNFLVGGQGGTLLIDAGAFRNNIKNTAAFSTVTDSGDDTIYENKSSADFRAKIGPVLPYPVLVSIAAGAFATNCATGNFFYGTGDANYQMATPTNPNHGNTITWMINQTAGRTVSFSADWDFKMVGLSSSDLITFLATYTGYWYFTATYHSTEAKWTITNVAITGLGNKLLGNTTITGRVLSGAGDSSNMAIGMNEAATGFFRSGAGIVGVCGDTFRLHANGINFGGSMPIKWFTGGAYAAESSSINRVSNSVLGLKDENGSTAQTFRIYGDATKYLSLAHNGTNAVISASSGNLHISSLPTTNPGPGILWNNAGTPAIGT